MRQFSPDVPTSLWLLGTSVDQTGQAMNTLPLAGWRLRWLTENETLHLFGC